jgi:hypothetical protein
MSPPTHSRMMPKAYTSLFSVGLLVAKVSGEV